MASPRKPIHEMETFLRRYNISVSWLADQLGVDQRTIYYYFEAGFPEDKQQQISDLLEQASRYLESLDYRQPLKDQLEAIRYHCGVKRAYFASQLGKNSKSFSTRISRNGYLTPEEVRPFQYAIQDLRKAMQSFQFFDDKAA